MNEHESIKKKRKVIYIIWLLPLVALFISAWMVYKYVDEKGENIIVSFDNAEGIVIGKTPLKYRGIKIGVVSDIDVDKKDISKFLVTIEVHKKALDLIARKSSEFWKVEPKATITEISGLNTILSGIYIEASSKLNTIEEIKKEQIKYKFEAISKKPINRFKKGVFFTLKSNKGDLQVGAPILYKNFVVGQIEEKKLKNTQIFYTAFIKEKYKHLVNDSSYFWNISGIDLKANLDKVSLKVGTLATVIAGGVTFDSEVMYEDLSKDKVFNLHMTKDERLYLPNKIKLIHKGKELINKEAKLVFNGVNIGEVEKIKYDIKNQKRYIFLKIKKEYKSILNYKPYFQIVKPKISLIEVKNVDTLIKGNYIKVVKTSKHFIKTKNNFLLNENPKAKRTFLITLRTLEDTKVNNSTFIYFKDIKIGKVIKKQLLKNSDEVIVKARIFNKYRYLVNDTTLFYEQSPVEFKASLKEFYLKTVPLEGFVKGAISLDVKNLRSKNKAKHFYLFSNKTSMQEQRYLLQNAKKFTLEVNSLLDVKPKDKIYYKGLEAGKVISMEYKNKKIYLTLFIFDKFASLINDSTKFYSISGVDVDLSLDKLNIKTQAIDNIVNGGISFFTPQKDAKKSKKVFEFYKNLEQIKEKLRFSSEGLRVVLNANLKSSLKRNSPIYYRQLQIGSVEKIQLSKDSTKIKIYAFIDKKYKHLIRQNSIFYNAGAFGVDLSFFGVKIKTETVETLLKGGISLINQDEFSKQALPNSEFRLYKDLKEEWLEYSPKIKKGM